MHTLCFTLIVVTYVRQVWHLKLLMLKVKLYFIEI